MSRGTHASCDAAPRLRGRRRQAVPGVGGGHGVGARGGSGKQLASRPFALQRCHWYSIVVPVGPAKTGDLERLTLLRAPTTVGWPVGRAWLSVRDRSDKTRPPFVPVLPVARETDVTPRPGDERVRATRCAADRLQCRPCRAVPLVGVLDRPGAGPGPHGTGQLPALLDHESDNRVRADDQSPSPARRRGGGAGWRCRRQVRSPLKTARQHVARACTIATSA